MFSRGVSRFRFPCTSATSSLDCFGFLDQRRAVVHLLSKRIGRGGRQQFDRCPARSWREMHVPLRRHQARVTRELLNRTRQRAKRCHPHSWQLSSEAVQRSGATHTLGSSLDCFAFLFEPAAVVHVLSRRIRRGGRQQFDRRPARSWREMQVPLRRHQARVTHELLNRTRQRSGASEAVPPTLLERP